MTLVDRIKKVAKERRGWNLKTTAQNAGIGINSIYRWKEQTPTIESLNKVATVLGVSVDYLLGKTDNPNGTKDKPTVDLNKDDAILTFDGKPIPEEDMELIKRLLGK
ncbi:helix-turn-helix transcriptional regulator [Lentilactobacillus parafarraginis]|jgi:transcriptional regulator with XRE-family HTH domain|uniref:Helix-turn-helix transcriptional regulator n=1 Tax=Lentilactobacillus parafarraginis TaxID=390842 RepID=A0A5R9CXP1_9LACO|nr:helix-turn-helix transcriptional regulator [Lentilactobacillus parafarraginis]TLQ20463.1 helix-turn-helix transcriptional regulator [Lentilactobacillus parafarraginis]